MQIPDVFARFRDDPVVAYRDTVTSTGPFGAESTAVDVWEGKGDLQQGQEMTRRFATAGLDIDAVLYLPPSHTIQTKDVVEVGGREWVVEETDELNNAVLIKARD